MTLGSGRSRRSFDHSVVPIAFSVDCTAMIETESS